MSKDKFTRNLEYLLKDFESDSEPKMKVVKLRKGITMYKRNEIKLPKNVATDHPYLIFILFARIKKFKFSSKWEKVMWEIPIRYKGTSFVLAHRKFGFEVNTIDNARRVRAKAIEALEKIRRAIPYAEKLIEPEIRDKVRNGHITLENHYRAIHSRYLYFREKANREFEKLGKFEKKMWAFVDRTGEGNYFATAMLDAYFSRLEHIFVLILPFVKRINLRAIDLEVFIGLGWRDKFKVVFDLQKNLKAVQLYEKLIAIKEEYRNPLSHGYFFKEGNSFFVHMEDLGAIPMTMTKSDRNVRYGFKLFDPWTFKEITKIIDRVDRYLGTHRDIRFGIKYLDTSLPVAFDDKSVAEYRESLKSPAAFEEMTRKVSSEFERAMNMDW